MMKGVDGFRYILRSEDSLGTTPHIVTLVVIYYIINFDRIKMVWELQRPSIFQPVY